VRALWEERLPSELNGVINANAYEAWTRSLNLYGSQYDLVGNLCCLIVLAGFILFGVGGYLMSVSFGTSPGCLIAGFVLFGAGGFSRVYVAKQRSIDYQKHTLTLVQQANVDFAPCRFTLTNVPIGVTHDHVHHDNQGINSDFDQHNHHARVIYRSYITIEYPTP
jgi:hypothetical protein